MAVVTGDTFVVPMKFDAKNVKFLDSVRAKAQQATKGFQSFAIAMTGINQSMQIFGTVSRRASQAIDATVGSAVNLQKSVAEITTLLDDGSQSMGFFTDEILEQQEQFGTDQTELAKAYYQALSSGAVDAATSTDLLTFAQKLAVGGVTDLAVATDGLTTLLNSYGISAEQSARVTDALFIGMRAGKTTVDALSASLGMAAPLAAATGVSMEELVASVSAITTGGVETAMAVTQVRSAMVGLSKQTGDLREVLDRLNISSIQNAISQDGMVTTLRRIIGQTDGTTESLTKLFGRIEAVNAVLALTSGSIGNKFNDIMEDMGASAENMGQVTEDAFAKIAQTADFRLGVLRGRFESAMTRIGSVLLEFAVPAIEVLIDAMEMTIDVVKRLSDAVRQVNWESVAVSIKGLAGAFLLLTGPKIIAGLAALAPAIWAVAAPAAIVAGKFLLIAAGVAAAVAAVDIFISNMDHLEDLADTIGNAFKSMWLRVQRGFNAIATGVLVGIEIMLEAMDTFGVVGEGALNGVREAMSSLAGEADEINRQIEDTDKQLTDTAKRVDLGLAGEAGKFIDTLINGLDEVEDKAIQAGGGLVKGAEEAGPAIPQIEGTLKDFELFKEKDLKLIGDVFGQGSASIAGAVSTAMTGPLAVLGAANMMLDAAQQLVDAIPQLLSKAANLIDSITDLPVAIVDGVKNLIGSIGRFISEFIPNIISSIGDLAFALVEGLLIDLPNALVELIATGIPDAFQYLLDRLPEFVEKLVFGLVSAVPRLIIALQVGLVAMVPRLAVIFVETMIRLAPEIGEAIVMGLLDGLKEIVNTLANVLGQEDIFDLGVDFSETEEQLKKLGDDISRSTSEMFEVVDIAAATRGMDVSDRIRNAIGSSTNRSANILQRLWDALVRTWEWIRDKILMPVFEALRAVWQWVWDNILNPIIEGLTAVWTFVWERIVMPLVDGLWAVWDWVVQNVVTPMIEGLNAVWGWVSEHIVGPVTDGVFAVWKWIDEYVVTPLLSKPQWVEDLQNFVNDLFSWAPDVGGIFGSTGGIVTANSIDNAVRNAENIYRANGGPIYAQAGALVPRGTDSVPAMLTPGEFVVNRESARANIGLLAAINASREPFVPATGGPTNINIVVNAKTNLTVDQVRREVVPEIERQLKQKSQRGEFVLSDRGVRSRA